MDVHEKTDNTSNHGSVRCLNCEEPVRGSFCSNCGQANRDFNLPFRQLVGVWFGAFAAFDVRLLGTLRMLVTRPGALTLEFLAGRRKKWIHPLKLYLAISLLLFMALGLSGITVVTVSNGENPPNRGPVNFNVAVSEQDQSTSIEEETPADTADPSNPMVRIATLFLQDPERFNEVFINRLAKAVFLLVPVFALLLKGLFRKTLYAHHIVFSLHQHTFAFLALLAGLVINLVFGSIQGPGNAVAVLVITIYTFLALRRCYLQSRFKIVMKMFVLVSGYLVTLLITMAIALFATSLTI